MFCRECGTKLADGQLFCTNCGTKLAAPVQPKPAPQAQAPVQPKPVPQAQAPVQPQPVPQPQAPVQPKPAPQPQAPVQPQPAPQAQAPVQPKPAPQPQAPVQPQPAPQPQAPVQPQPAPQPQAPVQPKPAPQPQAPVQPQPVPQPQAPVQPQWQQTPPPASVGEPKKKSKAPVIIIIVVIVALLAIGGGVGAYFFYFNNDEVKIEKQISAAEKCMGEDDFDGAIAAYEAVLAIDDKNEDAYIGLAEAYIGKEDYQKAADILAEALEKFESDKIAKKLAKIEEEYSVVGGQKQEATAETEEASTEPAEVAPAMPSQLQAYIDGMLDLRTMDYGLCAVKNKKNVDVKWDAIDVGLMGYILDDLDDDGQLELCSIECDGSTAHVFIFEYDNDTYWLQSQKDMGDFQTLADTVDIRWVYDHSTKGIIVEYNYNTSINADGHTQGFQVLRYEDDNLDTRAEFEYSGTDMDDINGEYAAEYENACKILRISDYNADELFAKNNITNHLNDPEQFASLTINYGDYDSAKAIIEEVKSGTVTEKRIADIEIK